MIYILALKIQNEDKMESFLSETQLLNRLGQLTNGDTATGVFSVTKLGEFKKYSVVFAGKLALKVGV